MFVFSTRTAPVRARGFSTGQLLSARDLSLCLCPSLTPRASSSLCPFSTRDVKTSSFEGLNVTQLGARHTPVDIPNAGESTK